MPILARFADWTSLSTEPVEEGAPDVIVRQLTHDLLFQMMLKNRIQAAKDPT